MLHDRHPAARRVRAALAALGLLVPVVASAQTDYYNLDAGRPLRIEDALVIERHAFEWQVAPFRISGARGRRSAFAVEPELAWGVLPRTQLEVGVPLVKAGTGTRALGGAGVDVSVLHALNTETTAWPGLAVSLGALFPAGPHGPSRTWLEFGALATRTLSAGRVHVNAAWAPGNARGRLPEDGSRWRVGVAGDRTFVVRSMLVGAELVAEEPLGTGMVAWSTAVGTRVQVGPRSALDLGVGRRLNGDGEWYVTMGSAVSFGLLHRFGGVR